MLKHVYALVAGLLFWPSVADARPVRLGPFEAAAPQALVIPRGDQVFSAAEALHGSFSTPEQCADVPDSVWVEADNRGDCIRFYPEGLHAADNPVVLVFFGGDVMLRNSKGDKFIAPAYAGKSPASLAERMAELSRQAGLPAIYVARPGTYGSSGDHSLRRHRREVELIDGAVTAIKQRHGIDRFVLVGQSGGGHLAAALLNRRADIKAAIISSGLVSVAKVMAYWENRRAIPGAQLYDAAAFYDPIADVANIPREPDPDIFVLSDKGDTTVPFATQQNYVLRLRAAGLKPLHILAQADGPNHHVLSRHAELAAVLYLRGETRRAILKAVAALQPLP